MNLRVGVAGGCCLAVLIVVGGCAKKVAKITPQTPALDQARTTPTATPQRSSPTPTSPRPTQATTATPTSRTPDAATRARIQDLLNRIQDAYYDYNQHTLRADAQTALQKDSQALAEIIHQFPDYKLTIEGHCDERGSEEYNVALGDARAKQAKEYLASLGVSANQLRIISYGKDRPVCTAHDEECWQKNRRAHITQEQ